MLAADETKSRIKSSSLLKVRDPMRDERSCKSWEIDFT